MPERRVTISYGRTYQSAPYESIRLDVSLSKDIADDANLKDEIDKSVNGLKIYVKNKAKEIIQNNE